LSSTPRQSDSSERSCLGCGHILDHLPEPRCPECGREFNPDNPRTFSSCQRTRRRWLRPAGLILAAWPLVALAAIYANWISAWITLGHRPRSSLDDPFMISEFHDWLSINPAINERA